jgi:hypothetical protein
LFVIPLAQFFLTKLNNLNLSKMFKNAVPVFSQIMRGKKGEGEPLKQLDLFINSAVSFSAGHYFCRPLLNNVAEVSARSGVGKNTACGLVSLS